MVPSLVRFLTVVSVCIPGSPSWTCKRTLMLSRGNSRIVETAPPARPARSGAVAAIGAGVYGVFDSLMRLSGARRGSK
jgi:hypothetical protein